VETIVSFVRLLAPVSVALIMFAQGLSISPRLVVSYFKERSGVMLRSLLAAIVLVPMIALALILGLNPTPAVAIGLAILVACPAAPLMLSAAPQKGGASAPFMASLHLSLALFAFVTVPVVLSLLSRPLGFHADVDLGVMAWILSRTILLPILMGLIVRAWFREFADRIGPVLGRAGSVGLIVVVLSALVAFYAALLRMDLWSYAVIAAVSVAALAIGHVLGPPDPHEKTALAVECAVRHPVLAIAIGAANFGPQRTLPVLVPCIVTFIAIAMAYMFLRKRGQRVGS
jgi:BASS family bile acid:Na+ symporter